MVMVTFFFVTTTMCISEVTDTLGRETHTQHMQLPVSYNKQTWQCQVFHVV